MVSAPKGSHKATRREFPLGSRSREMIAAERFWPEAGVIRHQAFTGDLSKPVTTHGGGTSSREKAVANPRLDFPVESNRL
jgi:hypothetical protein